MSRLVKWALGATAAVAAMAISAGAGLAADTAPERAAPERAAVDTIYDLYLGGIKAGELEIEANFQEQGYTARSLMRTAGIVGFFYKAAFEAETQGRLDGDGLAPDRFAADSRMREKSQYVEMIYGAGAPQQVNADPAFVPKPWQVDPAQQTGALDPITAALLALAPGPVGDICNQSVEVFDGRRRYAIDMGAPVADGQRLRCPAVYRRIAGFKPKMMKERPTFPFNIWFEETGGGHAHVVRAAGESTFGLAVVLLRE